MMYDMLHADSCCLTLLAKAIVKVQDSESSVLKEVQSEYDVLEAYKVPDDEDLPISLVVQPPKNKNLQVKQLLTFIGPTAATAKTDVKPRSYNRLSVDGLSDYVIDCVKKTKFNHFKSLSMYMNLADALQALMVNLQHYEGKRVCTKEECYPVIHECTGIPKSTYCSYVLFYKFMTDYPRFFHTSLTYNQIKQNQSAIRSWFSKQDITLPATDFISMRYWQQSLDASDGVSHFNKMSMDCNDNLSSQNSNSEE
ncbi:hypothetical protein HK100_002205 [Physocladia obscura]|uniref:Uncharacterized protein n=1 Tax=Physocladia obscura TaxID=109957 RepID=A0AAD5TA01_9FUNG|nr:hypothetical protein HK100_002205 [Physocladia obscura]